jgi:citrate lyase subunit beta/citryl-CoA lyase
MIPQVESTLSMVNMKEIFSLGRKRIIAAAFGADDFTADFEVARSDDDKELDFVRKLFALTCHAYGVVSIDTPYVHFKNIDGLKKELEYLKSIGMKAKFAIHPVSSCLSLRLLHLIH